MESPASNTEEELFRAALDIDEEAVEEMAEERGVELDLSDELKLLARQNYLQVNKTSAHRQRAHGGGWRSGTGLRIAGMPDNGCRFVWASLLIDLSFSPGAQIQSIEPEREGAQAVEFTNKTEPAIEAKIPGTSVKASLGGEREVKYTVTYPEVIGANLTDRAIWTFRAPSEDHELRLDHPLRLTVDFPQNLDALRAGLTIRARVAFRGFPGMIPLIGRRTAADTGLIRLDG